MSQLKNVQKYERKQFFMIGLGHDSVKNRVFFGLNGPLGGSVPGAQKNRTRFRGRLAGPDSLHVVEIAYDSVMGVVRMMIDVRGSLPGLAERHGRALPGVVVSPLEAGGASMTAFAEIATACGIRPAGILAESVSRPGRTVHGWLATVRRTGLSQADPPGADSTPALEPWPAGVILLAESVGSDQSSRVTIPWLLVRPECRRSGVGRALVAAAIDHARGLGSCQISIDTLDRWPEALAFWRQVGFGRA